MKSFENFNVTSVRQAVLLLEKFQKEKKSVIIVGGGSEILQLMKERVVTPDYVVNLKTIPGLNTIKEERGGIRIGALTTLVEIEEHPTVREKLLILSDGAAEAASPQIRNAGTIGGNLCQRPFCWYFRSAHFDCLRKGGQVCYSVAGDSRYHAIFGGGPSFIVHPSDLAPVLVALDFMREEGPENRLKMPLRAYVSIATLFSVILICSPSGTAAQEIRNKPSGRPTITRQATAADAGTRLARRRHRQNERITSER